MRIFSLTSGNGNHFDASVGESSIDESREKAEEAASAAGANVFLHGAWIFPVTEATTVMIGPTTKIDNESHEKQADDSEDLDGCENELGFTVDGDSEDVKADDKHDDDGDPGGDIDAPRTLPILNDC